MFSIVPTQTDPLVRYLCFQRSNVGSTIHRRERILNSSRRERLSFVFYLQLHIPRSRPLIDDDTFLPRIHITTRQVRGFLCQRTLLTRPVAQGRKNDRRRGDVLRRIRVIMSLANRSYYHLNIHRLPIAITQAQDARCKVAYLMMRYIFRRSFAVSTQ